MKIFICDDDVSIQEQLKSLLMTYFKKNNFPQPEIKTFNSGDDLLMSKEYPDILFLDIEMSGVNGICVGNNLHKQNSNIIIIVITSYSEYLDDAMRFNVFRYLSKPIDKVRLYNNLNDAIAKYNSLNSTIEIKCDDEFYTISTNDIIMIETDKRKSLIHTTTRNYVSTHNMKHWETVLNTGSFYRCHRCYIINMKYVYKHNSSMISLYNDKNIAYITTRKYPEFKSKYLMYLECNK